MKWMIYYMTRFDEIKELLLLQINKFIDLDTEIKLEDKVIEDLNIDSISFMFIIAELEKELKIELLGSIFIRDKEDFTIYELVIIIEGLYAERIKI